MRFAFLTVSVAFSALACGSGNERGEAQPADSTSGSDSDTSDAQFADSSDDTSVADDADGDAPRACGWGRLDNGLSGGSVGHVVYDPRVARRAYAVGGRRVYRSDDDGTSWSLRGETPAGIAQVALTGPSEGALIAATSNGVAKSLDGGSNWSASGLLGLSLVAIEAHPAAPLRVFVAQEGSGLLRSTNGGATWAPVDVGVPNLQVISISGDPSDPNVAVLVGIVYSTYKGYVLRTTDGGTTWTTVTSAFTPIRSLARCTKNADILWAGTDKGVARSMDRGLTWSVSGLSTRFTGAIANGPDCDTVFASDTFGGLVKSVDGGKTFGAPSGPAVAPPTLGPTSIAPDPASPSRILVGMSEGLFASTTNGSSWTQVDAVFTFPVRGLVSAPADRSKLWMTTFGVGTWKRDGLGGTWQRIPASVLPMSRAFNVAVDPKNVERVFVLGYPDLWRSLNGGNTFQKLPLALNEFSLGFDPADSNLMWVGTQTGGVHRSTDGGDSWAPSNDGLAPWPAPVTEYIDVRSVLVKPNGIPSIFIGTNGRGVYRSNSGGAWSVVATGYPNGEITCLAAHAGAIWVCVNGGGVLRSTDNGASWTAVNSGLTSLSVNGLVIDDATGRLYLTTQSSVYVSADGASWAPLDAACNAGGGVATILVSGSDRYLAVAQDGGVAVHKL